KPRVAGSSPAGIATAPAAAKPPGAGHPLFRHILGLFRDQSLIGFFPCLSENGRHGKLYPSNEAEQACLAESGGRRRCAATGLLRLGVPDGFFSHGRATARWSAHLRLRGSLPTL